MTKLLPKDAPPLVIDTREQLPYEFDHPSIISTLKTGDYSIVGLEDSVAVERKELGDFIGCCTQSRERFERELSRAEGMKRLWIVIEGTLSEITSGAFRSHVSPSAVLGTICAWDLRYASARFVFATNRAAGQKITQRLLIRAWMEAHGPEADPKASKVDESGVQRGSQRGDNEGAKLDRSRQDAVTPDRLDAGDSASRRVPCRRTTGKAGDTRCSA